MAERASTWNTPELMALRNSQLMAERTFVSVKEDVQMVVRTYMGWGDGHFPITVIRMVKKEKVFSSRQPHFHVVVVVFVVGQSPDSLQMVSFLLFHAFRECLNIFEDV